MELIWFLLIGLIAGWLAEQLTGSRMGLVANMIVGVVGAFIGGYIFRMLGVTAYGTLGTIIMAVIGAVILLFLLRLIRGGKPA